MKKTITSFVLCFVLCTSFCAFSQSTMNKIRIYDHLFNPHEHPDYIRKFVKPPNWKTFNYQTQFITLRDLEGDFKKKLDDYTIRYDLGKVVWPSYSLLYLNNINDIIDEIKKRDLFLFDIWGYVPGSGPGGYWQQFHPPSETLKMFETKLGDHWLGMDNGEQDGRYVGGYANHMVPLAGSRLQQYYNFQNHFQALCNELGNKMATLVSLNFGHYFLKEGVYTFIGAETAQGLPNAQVYYSFIRGASKQYGVPWFGNTSVWNRWGYKTYTVNKELRGGPTMGTSLSLLKRLLYSQIFYNSMMVGFESGFLNDGKLGSIGEIQHHANQWVQQFGQTGNMIIQVALMLDFYAGWSFPRHLYSSEIYKVWGNLPYEPGDYLTNSVLDMFYPGYQNSSYFHNENGFNVPTPYGDVVDCILSDSPAWLLQRYPVVVLAGKITCDLELNDKLKSYVKSGGHLLLTAENLKQLPDGLFGANTSDDEMVCKAGEIIHFNDVQLREETDFTVNKLIYPKDAEILASCRNQALAIQIRADKGKVTIMASPFGITEKTVAPYIKSEIDQSFPNPFPLLKHVYKIFDEVFSSQKLFEVGHGLSYIINRKEPGSYNMLICNNSWEQKEFKIESEIGTIKDIREIKLKNQEQKEVGYLPHGLEHLKVGKNSKAFIAGGSVRVFTVEVDESIDTIQHVVPNPKISGRFLNLHNILDVKQEILRRPTFFNHFDGVVIDWKYIDNRDKEALFREEGWISRQKLNLMIDLSSGINLFPDIRLVNNDSIVFYENMARVKSLIEKMSVLGSHDLILGFHRGIQNNFSENEFYTSLAKSVSELGVYAKTKNINIHLKLTVNHNIPLDILNQIINESETNNLFIAPCLPYVQIEHNSWKIIKDINSEKVKICFLSAYIEDSYGQLYDENTPLSGLKEESVLTNLLKTHPQTKWVFDGIYNSWNEEYQDIKYFNRINSYH